MAGELTAMLQGSVTLGSQQPRRDLKALGRHRNDRGLSAERNSAVGFKGSESPSTAPARRSDIRSGPH